MGIRKGAAVALTLVLVAFGASGCTFLSPVATEQSYAPSDGVTLTSGAVTWNNAMWVSDDGNNAVLLGRISNSGTATETVNVQISTESSGKKSLSFTLDAGTYRDLGDNTVVADLGFAPGSTAEVYLQAGSSEGAVAQAPVVSGEQPEYASLVPSPQPSN